MDHMKWAIDLARTGRFTCGDWTVVMEEQPGLSPSVQYWVHKKGNDLVSTWTVPFETLSLGIAIGILYAVEEFIRKVEG